MPDRRHHRGAHPRDLEDFAPAQLPALRCAAADLAWLLTHGYPAKASVKLVGDRYALRERQRAAIRRSTVGDPVCERRQARRVEAAALSGEALFIDGYNVLLSVETALGGGIVLASRDGPYRDMASMKGHYKRVDETRAALALLGRHLTDAGCERVGWYLDRPISNSGRLRKLMLEMAAEHRWPWTVELVASPDRTLAAAEGIVATADGWILDQDVRWVNLAREVIEASVPDAWVLELPARDDAHSSVTSAAAPA